MVLFEVSIQMVTSLLKPRHVLLLVKLRLRSTALPKV